MANILSRYKTTATLTATALNSTQNTAKQAKCKTIKGNTLRHSIFSGLASLVSTAWLSNQETRVLKNIWAYPYFLSWCGILTSLLTS